MEVYSVFIKNVKEIVGFLIDHLKTRERLFASFYSKTKRKKRKEKEQGNGQSETLTNFILKLV